MRGVRGQGRVVACYLRNHSFIKETAFDIGPWGLSWPLPEKKAVANGTAFFWLGLGLGRGSYVVSCVPRDTYFPVIKEGPRRPQQQYPPLEGPLFQCRPLTFCHLSVLHWPAHTWIPLGDDIPTLLTRKRWHRFPPWCLLEMNPRRFRGIIAWSLWWHRFSSLVCNKGGLMSSTTTTTLLMSVLCSNIFLSSFVMC